MPVHLIPPTWPLQRWGMDLVGPLPTAQGNCRFAAVAVDYFTKWVEAKPLANIKATTVQKFFWQNIVCRFGVPRACLDSWSRRARPSAQAVASPGQVKTGHLRVFGRPAQQSQAAMWPCLGGTWEPGRQPNC
jgi:hypothetical protein